jgi:HEAT repeat protein
VDIADKAEDAHAHAGVNAAQALVRNAVARDAAQQIARKGTDLRRRKALAVLYYLGDEVSALTLLEALLEDPSEIVRHEAAYYLGALRFAPAIPKMIRTLQNERSDIVRHELAEALGDMGAKEALPVLRTLVGESMVGQTAAIAIAQLSD